jgi:hypothetical protein
MIAWLCLAAFTAPAFAEEKPASPANQPQQAIAPMSATGAMGSMSEEKMDAHLRQIQEYLLTNYEFIHQIRETKDVKEQARLKNEWLKAMKHHMNQVPKQLMMHGAPEYNAPEK